MFIQTEITPNPSTLKFIPGKKVLDTGSVEFANKSEAKQSPLALRLFSVRGVESVFFFEVGHKLLHLFADSVHGVSRV